MNSEFIAFKVRRAYRETRPTGTDPATILPKICDVMGKQCAKIGLE